MKKALSAILTCCLFSATYAQQDTLIYGGADTIAGDNYFDDDIEAIIVTGVTGNTSKKKYAAPVTVLSVDDVHGIQSTNVVEALSRQPGIDQISTGAGISKPVIRGLGYNRVLVISQGVRQEGQQWGDEHGLEVDGNSVHSIEIQKGASSLMYGSDAMAGVIIMRDEPFPTRGSAVANLDLESRSNNGHNAFSLTQKGFGNNGIVWNLRLSNNVAHDYKAPQDGYVYNTRYNGICMSGIAGYNGLWGYSHLTISHYTMNLGMTNFEDGYKEGAAHYSILEPHQEILHEKFVSDTKVYLGDGELKVVLGHQRNKRVEFEEENEPGLSLRLSTTTYDIRYSFPEKERLRSNIGIGGMYQKSENFGDEFLIPDYHLFDFGVFGTCSYSLTKKIHLSGGARFDVRQLHSHELKEEETLRFNEFRRNFRSVSACLGGVYNVNKKLDLKVNLSRGFRAPSINELGSNGEHEGTFRYELGNADLKSEHNFQVDLSGEYGGEYLSLAVSLFNNRIYNYIYLERLGENKDDGENDYYQYRQSGAGLYGGEILATLHITKHLDFTNSISHTIAKMINPPTSDYKYLPNCPARRWISTLSYHVPLKSDRFKNALIEVEADNSFKAKNYLKANDTETPTDGYTLFNMQLGVDFHSRKGNKLFTLKFAGNNIFDVAYQNHLSRFKYIDTYQYTGRNGINNKGADFVFKINVPISLIKQKTETVDLNDL